VLGEGNAVRRIAYKTEFVQIHKLPKEGKVQTVQGLGYLLP